METWNDGSMRTDTGGEAYKTNLRQLRAALHDSGVATEEQGGAGG